MNKIFAIIMSFQLILMPVSFAATECQPGQDCYQVTGTGGEGKDQFKNSMLMTVSGAWGSLFMFCKTIPVNNMQSFSHYIFLGGAAVLLLAEIQAAFAQKAAKEEGEKQVARMSIANAGPGDEVTQEQKDTQLGLLELAKEEEIKNRDALKTRMDWMTAVEVVYLLAAAGAVVETYLWYLTKSLQASVVPATVAAGVALGYNDWSVWCSPNPTAVLAIGAAYGVVGNASKGAGNAVVGGLTVAGFMLMMNLLYNTTVGGPLNSMLATAPGRIALFGMFAALAINVRDGFKSKIDRANKNIAKIDQAIQEWTASSVPTNEIAGSEVISQGNYSGLSATHQTKKTSKSQTKVTKSGKCLSSNANGLEHSANACRKPLKFDRSVVKFDSKFLNGVANQAFDMSESFAEDDMGGAQLQASSLANNAARVRAETTALIKAANSEIEKNGGKTIDFDKEVKAQMASFSQMAQDAAIASGMKDSVGNVATLDDKKDEKITPVKPFVAPVAAVPARPMPNLSMGSEMPESAPAPGPAVTVQTIDDFETAEQDFSKQKDVSIFEQLSHRYFLNYSKVFERKKRPDVVIPEEVKKN